MIVMFAPEGCVINGVDSDNSTTGRKNFPVSKT